MVPVQSSSPRVYTAGQYYALPHAKHYAYPIKEVDLVWSLYNAFPNTTPRLERTKAATWRRELRLNPHPLPERKAYQTTVDYYEAVAPLECARRRFLSYYPVDENRVSLRRALASIVPRLF